MNEDVVRAIYWFTADYHSGQSSRGYRLNCKALRSLRRSGWTRDPFSQSLGSKGTQTYNALVRDYSEKM